MKQTNMRIWGGLIAFLLIASIVLFLIIRPPSPSPTLPTVQTGNMTPTSPARTTPVHIIPRDHRTRATPTPVPTPTPPQPALTGKPVDCPAQQPYCLSVFTSSYLGYGTNDSGNAVGLAADGTLVIGGVIDDVGKVVRVSSDGKTQLSQTPLGGQVDDLEVTLSNGTIAVIGDFGLTLLDAGGTSLWSKPLAQAQNRRVSIAADGTIVALAGTGVTLFNQAGQQLSQFSVNGANDLAVDSASGSVVVVGYTQKDGGPCNQLQVPFMRSYSYSGAVKWTNYDLSHAATYAAHQSCADARANRVAISADHMLYMLGTSYGGNSIYRYDPHNVSKNAPIFTPDAYSNPYNTSSGAVTFIAKYDLQGNMISATYLLARLGSGKGNSVTPSALAVDAGGNVYVGGTSAYQIANHDQQSISGVPVGPYAGYEGYLAVYSPDLAQRKVWTVWTGQNSGGSLSGSVNSIATAHGRVALAAGAKQNMVLIQPMQGTRGTGRSTFYAVLPTL